jgi:hypothetical protein
MTLLSEDAHLARVHFDALHLAIKGAKIDDHDKVTLLELAQWTADQVGSLSERIERESGGSDKGRNPTT